MLPAMESTALTLPDDIAELKQIIATWEDRYVKDTTFLREQIRLLRSQIFGRKSEKVMDCVADQVPLFDEVVPGEPEELETAEIVIPSHARKKPGRRPLPENLPRVEVIHDLAEEEKTCDCGCMKSRIGEEISEQLDIIPARIQVLRHIRYKYACRQCEGVEDEGPTVTIAPVPLQLIPKSIASAGLVAHVLTAKFVDALPFYRQEGQFKRLGLEISRATMCNWAIKAATSCQPLLELLRRENRSGPLINVDETTVQVLAEPGRAPTTKSYMWIFRGGDPSRPVLEFQYHQSRCGDVAAAYLRGYRGFVQTDGYVGYDFLDHSPNVVHVGCWAHVRRKFVEVIKSAGKIRSQNKTGIAEEAVARIGRIYALERSMRESKLDPDVVYQERQEKARPLLDDFHEWLKRQAPQTPPKSLLGKAISYALRQWKRLVRYLDDGRLRPDNNLAENAIRPFVVGRKNWLFSGNPEGAKASAALYSLIETAKANGLEPYWYLRRLFERLPLASTEEEYRALLPQYIDKALVTPP